MFTAKVTRIEDKGNFVTASIYTSEKDRDGEWQTHFFDAIFLGDCVAKAKKLQQKNKIDITDMTLSKRQYKDKEYVKVKIFGFTAEAEQTEYAEDYADFDQPISDIPF